MQPSGRRRPHLRPDRELGAILLKNAILVELPARGHVDFPGQCIQGMMFQFWRDPTGPVDTSCVAGMPGIRFVTSW